VELSRHLGEREQQSIMAEVPQYTEKSVGIKAAITTSASLEYDGSDGPTVPPAIRSHGPPILSRINAWIESLSGFEARGITRVLQSERQPASAKADLQALLLWFSANISVNNLAVGLFGPLVFQLGFLDSAMCSVFGALLGSCSKHT
jgi:hypothetical protein